MTLEDIFTSCEMKDGITEMDRVEELVSVMQREQDSGIRNVNEAAIQWSTIASTLAATESKDCLELFVRLGGLLFIDNWLQKAQKCTDDTGFNNVGESIAALLGALEKLPVDEMSISSGIGATVKNLLGHNSSTIKDKARTLFDYWRQEKNSDDVSSFKGIAGKDNSIAEDSGSEFQHSRSSDGSQVEFVKGVKIPLTCNQGSACTASCPAEEDGYQGDAVGSSIVSEPCEESPSIMEGSSGTASTEMPISPVRLKGNVEGESLCVSELNGFSDDVKERDTVKGSPDKFIRKETFSDPTLLVTECVSSTSNPSDSQPMMELVLCSRIDAEESELCVKKISPLGSKSDTGDLKHSEDKLELKATTGQGGECCSTVLQDLSSSSCALIKKEDSETSLSRDESKEEEDGVVNDINEPAGMSRREDPVILNNISKPLRNFNDLSDIEFEYGIDDALEVAWQVAKEVEREVVGYREPLYSTSSEKNSEDGVMQPGSPDSINGDLDPPVNEVPNRQNLPSGAASPNRDENLMNSKKMDPKSEDSQVPEAVKDPASNIEKSIFCFDLNQDISEEMDRPTTPISAPGLPAAPIEFKGTFGWKCSTPVHAETPSIEGSSYSSKQRQDFLNIDLNVAGDGDAQKLGFPSGEACIEASSKKAEKLKFDLNYVDDSEDVASFDWRMEGQFFHNHPNRPRSPSPASSSSSRQPFMKNIDLNDSLSFFDDSRDQRPDLGKSSTQKLNAYEGFKMHGPVLSIMGTRVEVSRNHIEPQTQSLLPNRENEESVMSSNLTRSDYGVEKVAYTHLPPPFFGYNGFTMGPAMSPSPAMYGGSNAYMVDVRGTPVVPQIMGPPAVFPPINLHPPFVVNIMGPGSGPPSGFNVLENTHPSLDMNAGLMRGYNERNEAGGLRQYLVPGQGGVMEEQMRSFSQPLFSGIGMKRKEPDGGWDSYNIDYKQQQPWR